MTIDERIEKLLEHQAELQRSQDKTQVLLVGIIDSIQRLERIALAHSLNIDDMERRLADLENRRRPKPQ